MSVKSAVSSHRSVASEEKTVLAAVSTAPAESRHDSPTTSIHSTGDAPVLSLAGLDSTPPDDIVLSPDTVVTSTCDAPAVLGDSLPRHTSEVGEVAVCADTPEPDVRTTEVDSVVSLSPFLSTLEPKSEPKGEASPSTTSAESVVAATTRVEPAVTEERIVAPSHVPDKVSTVTSTPPSLSKSTAKVVKLSKPSTGGGDAASTFKPKPSEVEPAPVSKPRRKSRLSGSSGSAGFSNDFNERNGVSTNVDVDKHIDHAHFAAPSNAPERKASIMEGIGTSPGGSIVVRRKSTVTPVKDSSDDKVDKPDPSVSKEVCIGFCECLFMLVIIF